MIHSETELEPNEPDVDPFIDPLAYYDSHAVSKLLQVSHPMLRQWRMRGVGPKYRQMSHNHHRRNMTRGQRAMVATNLATMLRGDNQHTKEGAHVCAPSQIEAADKLNVSRRSVQNGRTVTEKATQKVVAAVKDGNDVSQCCGCHDETVRR